MTYHAATYSRVSNTSQLAGGSIADQVAKARKLATEYGLEIVADYKDEGVRGILFDERSGLQQVIEAARKGEIVAVLYYDGDRAARDWIVYAKIVGILERDYRIQMIDLAAPTYVPPEKFDPYTQERIIYHSLKGMMAEVAYRQQILRLKSGMYRQAERGEKIPAIPPYGYDRIYDANGRERFTPNPNEYPLLALLPDLYQSARSISGVIRALKDLPYQPRYSKRWSRNSVRLMLNNPYYAGYVRFGKVINQGKRHLLNRGNVVLRPHKCPDSECKHPWTQEQWEALQALREENLSLPPRVVNSPNPLSGLMNCGLCGGKIHISISNGHKYFQCTEIRNQHCQALHIPQDILFQEVVAKAREKAKLAAQDPESFLSGYREGRQQNSLDNTERYLIAARANAEKLISRRTRLEEDRLDRVISAEDYSRIAMGIASQLDEIKEQLEVLEKERNHVQAIERNLAHFEKELSDFYKLTATPRPFQSWKPEELKIVQRVFRKLFSRIEVTYTGTRRGHTLEVNCIF